MASIDKELFGVVDNECFVFILFLRAIETGNLYFVLGEEPEERELDFGETKGEEEGFAV